MDGKIDWPALDIISAIEEMEEIELIIEHLNLIAIHTKEDIE